MTLVPSSRVWCFAPWQSSWPSSCWRSSSWDAVGPPSDEWLLPSAVGRLAHGKLRPRVSAPGAELAALTGYLCRPSSWSKIVIGWHFDQRGSVRLSRRNSVRLSRRNSVRLSRRDSVRLFGRDSVRLSGRDSAVCLGDIRPSVWAIFGRLGEIRPSVWAIIWASRTERRGVFHRSRL